MILAAKARSEKEKDKRTGTKKKSIIGLKGRFLNIRKNKASLLQDDSL